MSHGVIVEETRTPSPLTTVYNHFLFSFLIFDSFCFDSCVSALVISFAELPLVALKVSAM